MAWQKILAKQIDVTGTTANQIITSDGSNAYWSNSSILFDSSSLVAGLSGANTNINTVQTNLTLYASNAASNVNSVQTNLTLYASNSASNVNLVQTNLVAYATYANSTFSTGGGSSITVYEEGSSLTTALTSLNFVGSGVVASNTQGNVTVTIAGGGGSGSPITVYEEGSTLTTELTSLNFVGLGVVASNVQGNVTVTISGGGASGNVDAVQSNLTAFASYANSTFSGGGGGGNGFSNNQSVAVSNLSYSSNTVVKVYTFYNATTNSLDTIFV